LRYKRPNGNGPCAIETPLEPTNSLLYKTNFVSEPDEALWSLAVKILFGLSYQSSVPVAKRRAWTAQQKWYAIELKRKSPNKKLDGIIIAVKAKYDRDVSASTLHGWLKPESAAKIEQLVNATGQNKNV
jgi:hypothetical protein